MQLSAFSPLIQKYNLDLDYYNSKDFVHEGCLLILDSKKAWVKISSKIRNKINQAKKLKNVKIEKVKGTTDDMKKFRLIWFDPNDKTLPKKLKKQEIMYLSYLNNELVGGLILTPTGSNLYMHNLGANIIGKKNNITSLLLWNAVEDLENSQYKYIDIGVSFRQPLYSFFKHWQTDKYPILFNPPFIKPIIRLVPFDDKKIGIYKADFLMQNKDLIYKFFGPKFTILPRTINAIQVIIRYLKINNKNNIVIYKTFNNNYISRCVTETILKYCQIAKKIDSKTKAVMVIHEFGYPYTDIIRIKKKCHTKQIPLIENCAWSCESIINGNHKIGDFGDYVIYSLPKIFPMQYGSVLKGINISDDENWKDYQLLDFYKREIIFYELNKYLPLTKDHRQQKINNWHYLNNLFNKDGYNPYITLKEGVVSSVYMLQMKNKKEMNTVYKRYINSGVEIGKYYPENVLILPIHQNLSQSQLDYIYAVFRGYLNLCSSYMRKGNL